MKKKRVLLVILIFTIMYTTLCTFAGCSQDKKLIYDVEMRISCKRVDSDGAMRGSDVDAWVFPVDVSELYVERNYDGNRYGLYLSGIKYPDDAIRKLNMRTEENGWIGRSTASHFSLWKGDSKEDVCYYICERGNYTFVIYDCGKKDRSYTYNDRILRLYITVK